MNTRNPWNRGLFVAASIVVLLATPASRAASMRWIDPASKFIFSVSRQPVTAPPTFATAAAKTTSSLNSSGAGSPQTLVFSVVGDAVVTAADGTTTTVSDYRDPATGRAVNEAHLLVTGNGITDVYLAIYFFDELGNSYLDPDVTYASFDTFDSAQNLQADITGYVSDGYSVQLQIGNYDWDTGDFTLMATATAPVTYLDGKYIYTGSSAAPPCLSWTPDFVDVTIPEPVSGALALLGAAALFRRRRPTRPCAQGA